MSIPTNGTALRGYTAKGYSLEAIVAALYGATHEVEIHKSDKFFDDKVTVQFVARINGTVVTIYDYKSNYSDLTDMWNGNYQWHVGGRRGDDVVALLNSIGIDCQSER